MKKLNLAAAACLMATLAMAQTNEVTSVNVVGYYKVTIPTGGLFTLVALNLDAIDSTNQNLMGIFGTQLRAGAIAGLGDRVYKFSAQSGQYTTFQRKSTDGLYHNTSSAGWTNVGGSNASLLSGEAFWLKGATTNMATYDVVVMGEVVSVMTQQVNLVPGFQLQGYTFSTDVPINSTKLGALGTKHAVYGAGDRVYLWNGAGYTTLGLWTNGVWYTQWSGGTPLTAAATNVVPMGAGFWYNAKTNNAWSETNSYAGNL